MNAKRLVPFLSRLPVYSNRISFNNCVRNLQKLDQFRPATGNAFPTKSEKSVKLVDVPPPMSVHLVPSDGQTENNLVINEFDEPSSIAQLLKCGRASPIRSLEGRRDIQQNVWSQILKNKNTISINVYNTYIQVCIDNEFPIDYKTFLQLTQAAKPTPETYLLLLKLASRIGDVNEAVEILTEMKAKGIAADENVFNALIIGYTMVKGLEGANYVLGTMKLAHIPISMKTNWSILEGLVRHGKRNEFRQFLEIIPKLSQKDDEYIELMYALGVKGQHLWLEDILGDFDWDAKDRAFTNSVHSMCLDLTHRNQPEAAVYYYKTFLDALPDQSYGKRLLSEMITCQLPIEQVIDSARKLQAKNAQVLFDLASITLQKSLVEDSYKTFAYLPYLRAHFFWPLFQTEGRQKGEFGVFGVLKKMEEFNVKPDYSTMEDFVLRYVNMTDAKAALERITQVSNVMHRDVLSPMIAVLLKEQRVEDAKFICESSHKIPLLGDQLIRPLANAWIKTKNHDVLAILQKICESNSISVDWTGVFLDRCLRSCRSPDDCNKLSQLIRLLEATKLKITSTFYDHMISMLNNNAELKNYKFELEPQLEQILDISRQDATRISHPKDMNVGELESHLIELESKQMETRGVIRKLIMSHAKLGNHQRVQELRKHMQEQGYEESAGMKSSLFHSLALVGDLKFAKAMYDELKVTYPSFKIDTFKIIDFATLLVKNDAVDEAISLLHKETRPTKMDDSMDRNCWILLGAAKKPEDAFKLFQLLVDKKYCRPTNVILGPILRPFVNPETVEKLVSTFINCVEQYKATPLQLEVLCIVLESKNQQLLQKVINGISAVHGAPAARMALIAALAEKGLEKPILKLLSEQSKLKLADLTNRIRRWVHEDKLLPLKTIEAANRRLSIPVIDTVLTSSAIMKIYINRCDLPAALDFWRELEENEARISPDCIRELTRLLERNNFNVPESLRNAR